MMYSYVASRCTHIGCAALVATSLTVGIAAPQVTHTPSYGSRSVGLEIALTSAVLNTASASAEAAATSDPFKQILEVGLGLAIAPFWYLGFPVTFPIVLAADINYLYSTIARTNLAAAIGLAIPLALVTWPVGPFGIALDLVNRFYPAGNAVTASATGRSTSGTVIPDELANVVAKDGVPTAAGIVRTQPRAAMQAVAQAAATTFGPLGDFVYDLARNVALVAGLALTPLWWIGAPITFPIGWSIGQSLFPNDNWGLFPGLATFSVAVFAPFHFASRLFPDRASMRSSSAAALRPASARSSVAGKTAVSTAPVKRAAAAVRSSGKAKAAGAVSKRSPARAASR